MTFLGHVAKEVKTSETNDKYFNLRTNMSEYKKTGYRNPYSDQAMGSTNMGFESRYGQEISLVSKTSSGGHPASHSMSRRVTALGLGDQGVELASRFHLVASLRMIITYSYALPVFLRGMDRKSFPMSEYMKGLVKPSKCTVR